MKILARLPVLFLAALVLAPAALASTDSSGTALRTVAGVRAFQLSAAEGAGHEFARTPSFAWSPVPAAKSYEFELATSRSFTPNAIIWTKSGLTSPAVAIPLSLPWITGSPYSLYAHVRVVTSGGLGPWSAPYGFNMRWPTVPKPMQSYPGLLRWTPVAGANGYEVWEILPGGGYRIFTETSNVADERDYYTFHQDPSWTGVVHWRIRATRYLYGSAVNGLPAVSYGPWSPVYTSYNPPFAVGPLTPEATVSDVVNVAPTGGTHVLTPTNRKPHELTPAFVYSGNQAAGVQTELYRVYVFTDRDCLNTVFTGAIVGSPAYAPRPTGPLGLPQDAASLALARTSYLTTGSEGSTFAYDGTPVVTNEAAAAAAPPATTGTGGSGSGNSGGGTGGTGSSLPSSVLVKGAHVDLWDNDWSDGGYYWTVVPVSESQEANLATSLSFPAAAKSTTITVADATGIAAGDSLAIGPKQEIVTVLSIDGNTLTLTSGLVAGHPAGETVLRGGGGFEYRDAELTQDACAAGHVMTFAKSSTPVVATSLAPYVTGMSTNGRLTYAKNARPIFYGTPLVSWQPADSAVGYEVQWSKKTYPWKVAGNGYTFSTSALLTKLTPGTWYYRVRGYDPYLMGTSTEMSWSSSVPLRVAKPVFKLVG